MAEIFASIPVYIHEIEGREEEIKKNQRTFNDRVRAIKEQQVSLLSKQAAARESREPRDVCTYSLYTGRISFSALEGLVANADKGENKVERHSPLVKVVLRSMSPARCTRQRAGRDKLELLYSFHAIRFSNLLDCLSIENVPFWLVRNWYSESVDCGLSGVFIFLFFFFLQAY